MTILGLMVSLNRMEKEKGIRVLSTRFIESMVSMQKAIITMAKLSNICIIKYNGKIMIDDTLKAAIDAY